MAFAGDLTFNPLVDTLQGSDGKLFKLSVSEDEKLWTDENIDAAAMEYFPTINRDEALRPILFSNWTSKHYISVDRDSLREYTKARLRVFYEEELDVPLVLFMMSWIMSFASIEYSDKSKAIFCSSESAEAAR
jgi:hypothetical protein